MELLIWLHLVSIHLDYDFTGSCWVKYARVCMPPNKFPAHFFSSGLAINQVPAPIPFGSNFHLANSQETCYIWVLRHKLLSSPYHARSFPAIIKSAKFFQNRMEWTYAFHPRIALYNSWQHKTPYLAHSRGPINNSLCIILIRKL